MNRPGDPVTQTADAAEVASVVSFPDETSHLEEALFIEHDQHNRRDANIKAYLDAVHAENVRKAKEARQAELKRRQQRAARAAAAPRAAVGSGGNIAMAIASCEGYPRYVYADHGPASSASGKYGFLDGTWDNLDGVRHNGFRGYARAMNAPESVQDEGFWILYNRSGTSPWNASRSCWGPKLRG